MAPDNTHYLTKDGLGRLQEELQKLRTERMRLVRELENGDEGRDELGVVEKRIDDISQVLRSYDLIKLPPKHARDIIQLGATVLLKNDLGHTSELTILGTLDADPRLGRISNESPVGRALLGHKAGDVILVHMNTKVLYTVEKVRYGGTLTKKV
ncbi:MAG: GreA/GreB family elongation factor [Candidatus Wolfebacteria bacterium]|nr:GreA/GreB family elongation factor [Candidatus Wolfebacteria bacterium]